jgi:hypothetical protein
LACGRNLDWRVRIQAGRGNGYAKQQASIGKTSKSQQFSPIQQIKNRAASPELRAVACLSIGRLISGAAPWREAADGVSVRV